GWVAGHLKKLLESQGKEVFTTIVRKLLWTLISVLEEIRPTHVLNAAECTGGHNVDWCEDHKEATILSNVIGTMNLTDICFQLGVHCMVYATGCIYQDDEEHPIGGKGFTEEDEPNFSGSFYSFTKAKVEAVTSGHKYSHRSYMMKSYPNVLILCLRMPVSDDLHPRNFVTKLLPTYEHVVDILNSNTILTDLLPPSIPLAEHNETGIYNFTNPGAISHNEVLALFKKYARPSLEWKNFTLEEQRKVIKAERSNCKLDHTKLADKLREYNYPFAARNLKI
ncbi:hypothetical protein BDZ91DRAFT_653019, partial [Kalaharituber pfeilii]